MLFIALFGVQLPPPSVLCRGLGCVACKRQNTYVVLGEGYSCNLFLIPKYAGFSVLADAEFFFGLVSHLKWFSSA